jgi:hypothetical protein
LLGRNVASRPADRVLLRSPESLLGETASLLRTPLHTATGRSRRSERPFAILHRLARFRAYRGRVTAPGLFFRCQPGFDSTRSVVGSAPRRPLPTHLKHQRPKPVAEATSGTFQPCPATTPLQGFHPSGSKYSADFGWLGLPSRSARFLSLPESQTGLLTQLPDHRSRPATFRWARCSASSYGDP